MSVSSLTERPIFASEENEYLTPARPPLSRLAIACFLFSLLSLVALFNFDLVALPILSATFALFAYLMIWRNVTASGQWLALLGLGISILTGVTSYTSTQMRDMYLYGVAKGMAIDFVNIVSQDKLLEAYELTRPETERQVAGTSLEEAYRLVPELSREAIDAFKRQDTIKKIVAIGPNAKWEFDQGISARRTHDTSIQVVVRLINRGQPGGETVDVSLSRSFYTGIGAWHVLSVQ